MPELPEVETFRRYIESGSLQQTIVRTEVTNPIVLGPLTVDELRRRTEGSRFLSARRNGKQLFLELSKGGWLTWHFGMTGKPMLFSGSDRPRFARVLFHFDEDALAYTDPRMLGRIGWTTSVAEFIARKGLGPDALSVSRAEFVGIFERARGAIKPALLDQHKLAGIGNIYADEVLFQSRLDPRTEVGLLSQEDLGALHRNMRRVLRLSIDRGTDFSTFPRSYLLRDRRKKAACPRCAEAMETVTLGGRTTYFCPSCQERR
jgi:formamidopyrimidine-DNA glycosylase